MRWIFGVLLVVASALPAAAADKPALEEGKKLFEARCSVCHSLRYIEMQPRRSREAYAKFWPAEIKKMTTAYGAPEVSDSEIMRIAEYLTQLKGRP